MSEGVVVLQGWARVGEGRPPGEVCVADLELSGSLGDVGHQVLLPFYKSSQDLDQPQRVWSVALDSPSMILSYLEASAMWATRCCCPSVNPLKILSNLSECGLSSSTPHF